MGVWIFWARGLFFLVFSLVTYLTLTPNPDDAEKGFAAARYIAALLFGDAQFGDKVAHFAGYGALGATAYWAQFKVFERKVWIPALLAVYGALLEGVQGYGGIRSAEVADAVANGLGALAGFAGAVFLAIIVCKRQPV